MMDRWELEARTKAFALRVARFVAQLPKNKVADVLGYQLLRSGTSVGANYREAARAESRNVYTVRRDDHGLRGTDHCGLLPTITAGAPGLQFP